MVVIRGPGGVKRRASVLENFNSITKQDGKFQTGKLCSPDYFIGSKSWTRREILQDGSEPEFPGGSVSLKSHLVWKGRGGSVVVAVMVVGGSPPARLSTVIRSLRSRSRGLAVEGPCHIREE